MKEEQISADDVNDDVNDVDGQDDRLATHVQLLVANIKKLSSVRAAAFSRNEAPFNFFFFFFRSDRLS